MKDGKKTSPETAIRSLFKLRLFNYLKIDQKVYSLLN